MKRVQIVNPLPAALSHYEHALLDVLDEVNLDATIAASVSAEAADLRLPARLWRAAELIATRCSQRRDEVLFVTWPVFGYADSLTWIRSGSPVWVVVHDPVPLRRQVGMGRVAASLGRRVDRVGVIVHSTLAAAALSDRGWRSRLLPHPMLRPALNRTTARGSDAGITVLGQWKPSRSLAPLQQLAAAGEWRNRRRIYGRGWPPVPGWFVDPQFQSELALDAAISDAVCVLVPYQRYFQSGIAVRCLERLTPVVGYEHPFLIELFGAEWPGFVRDDDWAGAVARAQSVPISALEVLRDEYWKRCVSGWQQFAARLTNPDS